MALSLAQLFIALLLTLKPFFETIYRLRAGEEVLLYGKALAPDTEDEADVAALLHAEWDNEQLEYPCTPPAFHAGAALWAARTVYVAAQLLLYRDHAPESLPALLPPAGLSPDASALLSADLCLRMLPAILRELQSIDPDDALIPLLESHLRQWHYSGIGYGLPAEELDFVAIAADACALQLYADRVMVQEDQQLARHAVIAPVIAASTGNYPQYFWTA